MKPLKQRICVTLDPDVIEGIQQYAEYEGRSVSQYINTYMRRHLELRHKREKEKEENKNSDE